ncbi:MAG TPA: malonyl-ACP O-methyltransferase BioC [Usitatibacter sp.]|nr:malonyl-ACP O-methyltransferase BioC [Usitatibacter sp.]
MPEPVFPDKRAVRRSFERAAAAYEGSAVLQREVGQRLIEHLDPIRVEPVRVLDLGCGTGQFFAPLGERFPRAQLVGLDLAHGMLLRARSRNAWWRRALDIRCARLVCADAERLPLASACTGLVFSNLALQWCRPELVFAESARVLAPGGLFMFSTFGPDTLKELRAAFAAVDAEAHVNTFIDMHDLGDALGHAGFADPVMEMEMVTLEYSSVETMARDLKAIGAHNSLPGRRRGLSGRRRWQRVVEHYEAKRRAGALPATYEVIYGHAWKAAPRRTTEDGRQVIEFHPRGAR